MPNELEMSIILERSLNNSGALNVMSKLYKYNFSYIIMLKEIDIKGSQIWILYKDVCNQNIKLFIELLEELVKNNEFKYNVKGKEIELLQYIKEY